MTLRHFAALSLLALAAASPLAARLGESAADLKKRFGRPEAQPAKNVLVWLIEEPAGALIYTVTLNDRGLSIAEGLKPYRAAPLPESRARDFVSEQVSVLANPSSARVVKPGESYRFGGETLTCGPNEHIVVDDANNLLVVWTKGNSPSVMAATHEVMAASRR